MVPDAAETREERPGVVQGILRASVAGVAGSAREDGPAALPVSAAGSMGPAVAERASGGSGAPASAADEADAARAGADMPVQAGFVAENLARFLAQMSTIDLRLVLAVLGVQGKMQAKNKLKRSAAMGAMQRKNMDDETLEAVVDEAAAAGINGHRRVPLASTPCAVSSAGRQPCPGPTNGDAMERAVRLFCVPLLFLLFRSSRTMISRSALRSSRPRLCRPMWGPRY